MCLDVGHANVSKNTHLFLPSLTHRIAALHLHDNNGTKDEHLIPGDGIIDFVKIMKELIDGRYAYHYGIECLQRASGYEGTPQELPMKIFGKISRFHEEACTKVKSLINNGKN